MAKSTTARGYGWKHQQARKRWARLVELGDAFCSRCGRPIVPGMPWDLDHSDDRGEYRGASHRTCNRRAGGRNGAAVTNGKRHRRTSRLW